MSVHIENISKIDDKELMGVKAFNLRLLWKAGCNVPPTYVLSTRAYRDFLAINELDEPIQDILNDDSHSVAQKSQKIESLIMGGALAPTLDEELCQHPILNRRNISWAVRSSSTLEDLPAHSFAGLYESYLNITGSRHIINAVKRCWGSLWSERAIVYRERNLLPHAKASMAVILQEMVDAKQAGVLFTRNPTSVHQNEIFGEYCVGLAEPLVSGLITPYRFKVERDTRAITHLDASGQACLSNDEIGRLSAAALDVEKHFGSPQDIEWAYDGNTFFFLQTRNISGANAVTVNPKTIVWTRANVGEVLPNAVTPLTWAIFKGTLQNNLPLALEEPTQSDEKNEGIRLIHGRVYVQLDRLLASFCYLPSVLPTTMTKVLGVNIPKATDTADPPAGILLRLAQTVFVLDAFGLLRRLDRLVKKLGPVPAPGLERLDEIVRWNAGCFQVHLKSTAYSIGAFGLLSKVLHRWFPSEADALIPLIMTGNEDLQTAAQGISLWQLAGFVRQHQDLREILEARLTWPKTVEQLEGSPKGREFKKMFEAFLAQNGARAAGEFELAVPRWREDPSFVLGILGKFLETIHGESSPPEFTARMVRRQEVLARMKSTLKPFQRLLFQRLMASYQMYSTLRENVKYRLMEGYEALRKTFLEIGENLVKKEILQNAADVFFLRPNEVHTLAAGGNLEVDAAVLVSRRRDEHTRFESEEASDLIVEGAEGDLKPILSEVSGIGCSPGVTEGIARVLSCPSEIKSFRPGEILVAPHTDPGWTPLFLSCKAVVTEIGGFLSHGATVAREYGIPAVVNVPDATSRIHSGDLIRVNGTTGVVTLCG